MMTKIMQKANEKANEHLPQMISDAVAKAVSEHKECIVAQQKQILTLSRRIEELERKCDIQEQYSRRTCLRISNFPNCTDDKLEEKFVAFCHDKLEVNLEKHEIDRIHRVGPKNQDKRQVICKFLTYKARSKVYSARFKLKQHGLNIYVNEDLTPKRAKLMKLAREEKKGKNIIDCWTVDGKVLIKLKGKGDKDEKTKELVNVDDLPSHPKPSSFPSLPPLPPLLQDVTIPKE